MLGVPNAGAAGFTLPVHGVRPLAVGGAQVAGATGLDAFWYNPSRLDHHSVGIDLAFIDLSASYLAPAAEVTVENTASPLPNPSLGGVWRVNDILSFGLGAYAPWSGQYRFPETGTQRYALVENDKTVMLVIHAAVAARIGAFRIGAGIQNVYAHIKQRSVLSAYSGLHGEPTDLDLDILSELELSDPVTLTGNFGVSYDTETVTLGASLQLPYTVAGEADFRNRLPSSVFFDGASLDGARAFIELPFPLIFQGGAQWRFHPEWWVEASVKYEGWSVQEKLTIDPQGRMVLHGVPAVGDYVMTPIVTDRQMKDTVSLHLGADGEIVKNLHLRGGLFWEPSSFPDETFSVALLDDDKVGIALGVSWLIGPVRVDAAVSRVFQGRREIDNSTLTQINPTNQEQAVVIGNGTYDSSYWVGGLGVSWLIGGPQ